MPTHEHMCQGCKRTFKNRGTLNCHVSRARRGLLARCIEPSKLMVQLWKPLLCGTLSLMMDQANVVCAKQSSSKFVILRLISFVIHRSGKTASSFRIRHSQSKLGSFSLYSFWIVRSSCYSLFAPCSPNTFVRGENVSISSCQRIPSVHLIWQSIVYSSVTSAALPIVWRDACN